MLRPGNAGSNTAADHIEATRLALAQLPPALRRRVLIRADSGGGTHEFLAWLASPAGGCTTRSGFTITEDIARRHPASSPTGSWTPAYDADGAGPRRAPGSPSSPACSTWPSWPEGMRVIVRKERPHPGAQLRFTDLGGHRFTCFATSTRTRAAR